MYVLINQKLVKNSSRVKKSQSGTLINNHIKSICLSHSIYTLYINNSSLSRLGIWYVKVYEVHTMHW